QEDALERHGRAAGDALHLLDEVRRLAAVDGDLRRPAVPQLLLGQAHGRSGQQPAEEAFRVVANAVALRLPVGRPDLSGGAGQVADRDARMGAGHVPPPRTAGSETPAILLPGAANVAGPLMLRSGLKARR